MKFILTILISTTGIQGLYSQGYKSQKVLTWYEKYWKQYIDIFNDGTAGIILGCLISLVVILIICMIVYGIYTLFNICGLDMYKEKARVINKTEEDDYTLKISIFKESKFTVLVVDKKFYKHVTENEIINVDYIIGRLDNKIDIVNYYFDIAKQNTIKRRKQSKKLSRKSKKRTSTDNDDNGLLNPSNILSPLNPLNPIDGLNM